MLVQNGLLRLQATAPNRSAMVQTLGKFQMTYGRVEAAIRLPRGQGFWPAFWLQTTDVAHGDPEIDILEMWMTDATDDLYDEHTISQNYHYQYRGQKADVHSWVRSPVDYTRGFHHFAIEWEPGVVRWYIDGVKTKEYRNTPASSAAARCTSSSASRSATPTGSPGSAPRRPRRSRPAWTWTG